MRSAFIASGGGIRSAAFSLGALKYLDKVNLLTCIESMAAVSGGALTVLKYIEHISIDEKSNYSSFYNDIYKLLVSNNIHIDAVENLNSFNIWYKKEYRHKERNLINSFAISYDKYFGSKDLSSISLAKTHIKEIIIYATDISSALPFRFKISIGKMKNNTSLKYYSGNNKLDKSQLRPEHFKLGDIMAATSCFPLGFEPMRMPSDFYKNHSGYKDIPLMDGGIINNQGINDFSRNHKNFDLIVVCDVASDKIENQFSFSEYYGFFSIIFTWLSVFIFGVIAFVLYFLNWHLLSFVLGWFVMNVLALRGLVCYVKQRLKMSVFGNMASIDFNPVRFIPYFIDRFNSFKGIVSNVFLKNNRSESLRRLYESTERDLHNKTLLCPIYVLEKGTLDIKNKKYIIAQFPEIEPNGFLRSLGSFANKYPTTLWLNKNREKQELEKLIMAGEISMCFSMICFLYNHKKNNTLTFELEKILDIAKKDWIRFNAN